MDKEQEDKKAGRLQAALEYVTRSRETAARLAAVTAERDTLQQQLADSMESRDTQSEELAAVTAERDTLRTDLDAVTTERDTLQGDLGEVTAARDTLLADLGAATDELTTLRAERATLENAMAGELAALGMSADDLPGVDAEGQEGGDKEAIRADLQARMEAAETVGEQVAILREARAAGIDLRAAAGVN